MNRPDPIELLNRLLQRLFHSLPVYLQGTHPWIPPGGEQGWKVLVSIASDQLAYAARLADAIQELGGRLDPGHFPAAFTGLHDVALGFLLRRVAEHLRRDIRCLEQSVAELTDLPRARLLVEEILGNARGHLEMVEETLAQKQP